MRKLLLLLSLLCFTFSKAQVTAQEKPLVIGQLEFYSAQLKENRLLNVYLPDGYTTSPDQKYPVIYLLDGGIDEDFLHITGLVQFASFEWIGKIQPSIVVGIANVDRKRDFTYPSTNKEDKELLPASGGSAAFIAFLEKEVIPLVSSKYRASGSSTIIGQSLGGLLATEILLKKPSLFNSYIIVSPSIWWDSGALLNLDAASATQRNVYVTVGKEGEEMEQGARKLAEKLTPLHNVFFEFSETSTHADILHFAVYSAFGKLKPKTP
jgi:uncharacterized protein